MKSEELMIGDWVQIVEPCKYAGAIGTIKTLIDHKDDENAYFKVFLRNNTIHIGIEDICSDDIKPIPITSEILKKNFEKKVFYDIYGIYDDYFDFDIRLLTDGYYMCNYHNCEFNLPDTQIVGIGYVHELQHVLRLCGINKMIEL